MTTPNTPKDRFSLIGPGIIVAATGVGAGDLVATLVAGSRFGYALLWAAVAGAVLKIALAEGVGRWSLATGRSMFDGWASLGAWARVYFGFYIVIWGFVYGAAGMTATALPLAAAFPQVDLKVWAIAAGLAGAALTWIGRYNVFETVMTVFVGVMFVTVVGLAVLVGPNLPATIAGLVPMLPQDSAFYVLGLIGGVGGTITVAAYGYWIGERGWQGPGWMRVMRQDNAVGYTVTGIFVVAMLIVGAELLYASGIALRSGDRGLLDLDEVLKDRFGPVVSAAFLVGFFATAFSSILGVWQGVSLMFADFVADTRERASKRPAVVGPDGTSRSDAGGSAEGWRGDRSKPFRAYVLWLTFPPMALLFMDRPFALIIAYGVLGAVFMPFLALTLLWLLNSKRMPVEHRSGWVSNGMLTVSALLFLAVAGQEIWKLVG